MDAPPSPSERTHSLSSITTPITPSKSKHIHQESAAESLTSNRTANRRDAGSHVPVIPLKQFFDNFLPPLKTSLRPSKILTYLKQDKAINDNGWTMFETPKPRKRVHEDICYSDVKKVITAIIAAAQKANKNYEPLEVVFKPNHTPQASFLESTCRPDCCICLRLRGDNYDEVWWDYIVIVGEFKKDDENVKDTNLVP